MATIHYSLFSEKFYLILMYINFNNLFIEPMGITMMKIKGEM